MRNLNKFAPALGCIPADDRDVWITVGMALHHESGGGDEGRRLWDTWSQRSQKYNSAEQESTTHSPLGVPVEGVTWSQHPYHVRTEHVRATVPYSLARWL